MKKLILIMLLCFGQLCYTQVDTDAVFQENRWIMLTSSNNVSLHVCYKKFDHPNVAEKGYIWNIYVKAVNNNPYAMRTDDSDKINVYFYYYSKEESTYKTGTYQVYNGNSSYYWLSEYRSTFGSTWVYSPYEIIITGVDRFYFKKKE